MSDVSASTRKLLSLSMLSGVGPAALRKASQTVDFETKTVEALSEEVPAIKKATLREGAWSQAMEFAEQQLNLAEGGNVRILSPLDLEYPRLLATCKDDPFILYVRGLLAPSPAKSVAIIGTREPTAHGEIITKRIARFFVEQGWSVVSGLALGCDALAHQETLEAKGHTVAVLAHGLQTIAPAKHRSLAEDILNKGGALVSQYPFGREAIPMQFAQRDKTQAGMAQGVVMIQSDLQGGSLHASRAALAYGRWLAVPYPTQPDRERAEAKVQANLAISDGSNGDAAKLLRCEVKDLSRVIVLRSRNDYEKLVDQCAGSQEPSLEPKQRGLL